MIEFHEEMNLHANETFEVKNEIYILTDLIFSKSVLLATCNVPSIIVSKTQVSYHQETDHTFFKWKLESY